MPKPAGIPTKTLNTLKSIASGEPAYDEMALAKEAHRRLKKIAADQFDIRLETMADWRRLAWALAIKHEPSLRPHFLEDVHRYDEWDIKREFSLWWDVVRRKERNPKDSVQKICDLLAEKREWKPVKGSTLRSRYQRLVKACPGLKIEELPKHIRKMLKQRPFV